MRFLPVLVIASVFVAAAWTKAPPLPSARSAHGVVVAAGAIHVLGGPQNRAVDRFDGRRWARESTLPGPALNAPAVAAIGSRIYVIGGFDGVTNIPVAAVRVFDASSRTWSTAADLPAPRGGAAAVLLDGKIHVLGGGNDVSTIADHSVYDPASDAWSAAAPLPRPEGSAAAVALDGKVWAIGGRSGFDDYGGVYVWSPANDSWTRGPSIPARGTAGAAIWRGSVYVFGGESQRTSSVLGDVYRLAPGGTAWKRVSKLPTARNYARAVVFGGRIYVVGGSTTAGAVHATAGTRVVERFSP